MAFKLNIPASLYPNQQPVNKTTQPQQNNLPTPIRLQFQTKNNTNSAPNQEGILLNQNMPQPSLKSHSVKRPRTYNREIFLKEYLQSLLKWTYNQNPEFAMYLKEDELTTWYIKNMKHPEWFTQEESGDFLSLVADMTDYIRQYKDSAQTFIQTDEVQCTLKEVME